MGVLLTGPGPPGTVSGSATAGDPSATPRGRSVRDARAASGRVTDMWWNLPIGSLHPPTVKATLSTDPVGNTARAGAPRPSAVSPLHGNPYAALGGHLAGAVVARVDVPDDAHAGVVGEHPLDLLGRERRAVRDAHLAGVDRATHADAAAVVDRDPAAPDAVLTSALSSAQSAIASEPSSMASVSR